MTGEHITEGVIQNLPKALLEFASKDSRLGPIVSFIKNECMVVPMYGMPVYTPLMKTTFHNKVSGFRKVNVGERKLAIPEKVILLVGATGSGKSTLADALLNYVMDIGWKDSFSNEIDSG